MWGFSYFLLLFIAHAELLDELCGITVYFNPLKHETRKLNFFRAREWSKRQQLKLIVVELAFTEIDHDTPQFDLQELNDDVFTKYIRLSTMFDNILWHKETLLNIGLDQVNNFCPKSTKIIWMDSDVILEDGWLEATSEMLNEFIIGQPFTQLVRLPKGIFNPYSYWSEPRIRRLGYGYREGQTMFSVSKENKGGYTGFVWAARRLALEKVRFYNYAIVGGFDALLVHVLIDPKCETRFNIKMQEHFDIWAEQAYKIFGSQLGTPKNTIIRAATFWHGEIKDRIYQDRHQILLSHQFDPETHVSLDNTTKLLSWTSKANCEFRKAVFDMFVNRNETGENMEGKVYRFQCNISINVNKTTSICE